MRGRRKHPRFIPTAEQGRSLLARQLSGGCDEKEQALRGLPLFAVACDGAEGMREKSPNAKQPRPRADSSPRVTPADIAANIVSEHYFTGTDGVMGADLAERGNSPHGAAWTGAPLDLLTFCVLVLRNGFTVTGESACASPANFDAAIGRRIARENAVAKVWPLLGYALKEQLYQASRTTPE